MVGDGSQGRWWLVVVVVAVMVVAHVWHVVLSWLWCGSR
jgi:hypothetical protein